MGFIEIVRRDARKASMTRIIHLVCEEIMVARPISNTHIPHIKIITNTAGRSRKNRNGNIKYMTFKIKNRNQYMEKGVRFTFIMFSS
ncbi:hypothetical protein [Roseburia inulinivorans]|jgi:hypothetical protein|uniref:hypothetical protein n=1 Tax=Roseburia inulinivorans TaxID=360807 RepID=UPI0011C0CF85|nr:hypothetical protein [Roseburia inulinivorans]